MHMAVNSRGFVVLERRRYDGFSLPMHFYTLKMFDHMLC